MAKIDGRVFVRTSEGQDGPIISYSVEEWDAFAAGVKAGEFDSSVL